MRKKKDTHSFDFRPLGLAIREAREKAGLSRNDLGDKVFYGERHLADIENIGTHPSFQLFHDLVTMFNISVDEYFYPSKKAEKSTVRRQIDSSLDLFEYSCAVTPQIRQTGNRLSGNAGTAYASLLA